MPELHVGYEQRLSKGSRSIRRGGVGMGCGVWGMGGEAGGGGKDSRSIKPHPWMMRQPGALLV